MRSYLFEFAAQHLLVYILATFFFSVSLLAFRYWKYRCSFTNLPSFNAETKYIYLLLKGKIPKDCTSYIFQEVVSLLNSFETKGLVLIWYFQPILFILGDEYIKIFSNERSSVNKAPFVYSILEEMVGNGLLTANGDLWRNRRKMMNPAFRFEMLKDNIRLINKGVDFMVKSLAEVCNNPSVDIIDILKLSSLKILCGSVLEIDTNDDKYDLKMRRYLELLNSLSAYTMYRMARPWLYWRMTNLLLPCGRRHRELYEEFHNFTNNLVIEMMSSISSQRSEDDSKTHDASKRLNHILLEAYMKNSSFSMQNIQEEVANIIFAGHDTTAHTLLWCVYVLGSYPEVQKKAFAEAKSVLGNNKEYSYSDLSELSYIECVIKETLRLYPSVPFFARKIDKDFEFGYYKIPKGTNIVYSPYMVHRNPRYFPDPEKFDPERFSKNEVKPWTYIPFSEGMRSCIGKRFAMMTMKIALAHILRQFEITSLDKREDIQLDWKVLLMPKKPLRLCITSRSLHE